MNAMVQLLIQLANNKFKFNSINIIWHPILFSISKTYSISYVSNFTWINDIMIIFYKTKLLPHKNHINLSNLKCVY